MRRTKSSHSSARSGGRCWLKSRSSEKEPDRIRSGGSSTGCEGTRSIAITILAPIRPGGGQESIARSEHEGLPTHCLRPHPCRADVSDHSIGRGLGETPGQIADGRRSDWRSPTFQLDSTAASFGSPKAASLTSFTTPHTRHNIFFATRTCAAVQLRLWQEAGKADQLKKIKIEMSERPAPAHW